MNDQKPQHIFVETTERREHQRALPPVYVDAERIRDGGRQLAVAIGYLLNESPEAHAAAPRTSYLEARKAIVKALEDFNYCIGVAGFSQSGDPKPKL